MKNRKIIFAAVAAVVIAAVIIIPRAIRNNNEKNQDMTTTPVSQEFEIVTSMGTMKMVLYDGTPKHKANFTKLVQEHFYDGILFHRVINGFMIQAGDPLSKDEGQKNMWGTGGPGYTVPAEIKPEYFHKKGAIAAARRGDMANPTKASSGSQFYIVQDDMACYHLDGQYTVFGEITEGLDIIDEIACVPTDAYDRPVDPVEIITIRPVAAEDPDATTEPSDTTIAGKPEVQDTTAVTPDE